MLSCYALFAFLVLSITPSTPYAPTPPQPFGRRAVLRAPLVGFPFLVGVSPFPAAALVPGALPPPPKKKVGGGEKSCKTIDEVRGRDGRGREQRRTKSAGARSVLPTSHLLL